MTRQSNITDVAEHHSTYHIKSQASVHITGNISQHIKVSVEGVKYKKYFRV